MMLRHLLAWPMAAMLLAGCSDTEPPPPASAPAAMRMPAEMRTPAEMGVPTETHKSATGAAVTRAAESGDEMEPPVADLAAVIRQSDDPSSRREAVYAIADAGSDADLGFVGQALADPDAKVRRAAVEALAADSSEAAPGYLALALNDPDPRVRLDATEALGNFRTPEARLALLQAANDEDAEVRAMAEEMLAEPERERR
jgi:HEAT repeat protein